MEEKIFTGYLEDNRSEAEKSKDFRHEELDAGAGAVFLTEKEAEKSTKLYKKLDQKSTSSCVAHSASLALGIDNELEGEGFVDLSRSYVYRQRSNFPYEGMYYYNVGDICTKTGDCLETTLPTPTQERDINNVMITNSMIEEGKKYRSASYIFMTDPTMEQLKNVANGLHKGILVSIFANRNEWSLEYPEIKTPNLNRNDASIHHCVTILPDSVYEKKGKKYVIVQDSAWFGNRNIRHLSEEFVKERLRYALYFLNLPNPKPAPKNEAEISFKYTFTRDLTVGSRGEDVKMLQMALAELGFFTYPTATGYFGGITRKAVIEFQEFYSNEVLKFFGLTKGTGYVGRTTKAQLHKLMI